jgi:hypothetical protein
MGVVKTWNSIARASMKTFNGIAAASVKTINGLDATTGGFTLYAENTSAVSGTAAISNGTNTYYAGQGEYVPGANITVREVVVNLTKTAGSISGFSYVCEIYTVTGGNNDLTTLIQASSSVSGDNGWSATPVTFAFAGAALTSGTKYGIALTRNTAVDASNVAAFDTTAPGGLSGSRYGWKSDKLYGTFSTGDVKMKIYIQ